MTVPHFSVDEARVLVDALWHHRMSGPPDDEGFIGRTPVDPERLADYVAARQQAYLDEAARDAEMKREWASIGAEYVGPERLRIGDNVDLPALVVRLRALEPAERAAIVQTVLDIPSEETDEDGDLEPEPHFLPFTYQYLSEAGLIDRPARPFQVMAYWYECEWRPPRDAYEAWDGTVYRCNEIVSGPYASEEEAQQMAGVYRARERSENPAYWHRRFRVRDIRDRFPGREMLQLSPEEMTDLLPPAQRQPRTT